MRAFWLGALFMFAVSAIAEDFRPFGRASRAAIERAHAGHPFALVFWSVDCVYCGEEIRQLGELVGKYPALRLVLVNTDSPEMAAAADKMLNRHLLTIAAERWMFDGGDADRLYFAVDRQWHGELPRAHFYDAKGNSKVITGQVEERWLKGWAKTNCADL